MGSGYAEYNLKDDDNFVDIPLVRASADSLKGLGEIVATEDYDTTQVIQVQWPTQGTRPVAQGTGYGSVSEGLFNIWWEGDKCLAENQAVGGNYTVCQARRDASDQYCYTREANYHPDGGQIVCPSKDTIDPFILVLGRPGDDIKPSDLIAFYCDGSFGVQILPGVWHQPVIPLNHSSSYRNKQGSIHACVVMDSIDETGVWIRFKWAKI
jgi:hypothetical protein